MARSTATYTSRLAAKDAPALAVMRELALQHARRSYHRIRVLRGWQGYPMRSVWAYDCAFDARANGQAEKSWP